MRQDNCIEKEEVYIKHKFFNFSPKMKRASVCVVELGSGYHEVQPLDQTK